MLPHLPLHPLFTSPVDALDTDSRIRISYARARLVLTAYNLHPHDVHSSSPRFWQFMSDPIMALDTAMYTILAAHVGLTIGTLAPHIHTRPDLRALVHNLLRFHSVGLYLLTERGHGLDAFNVETTATMSAHGFTLHTPREQACKFMPASTPLFSIPKIALVMARLIIPPHLSPTRSQQDLGPRFFLVPICTSTALHHGVESIRLPPRPGTSPLDFAITRFTNLDLPFSALIAPFIPSPNDLLPPNPRLHPPQNPLDAWWAQVWRIPLGTLAVTAPWISALKFTTYIAASYSLHRSLVGKGPAPVLIIHFRTQHWPIISALAAAEVLAIWFKNVVRISHNPDTTPPIDPRIRHALAVIAKTTICRHFQRSVPELAERCGAQGTFEQNYMARIENDAKGVTIAEGDILTLSIRLFSELLQDRYTLPLPPPSSSLLAYHAHTLLSTHRQTLSTLPTPSVHSPAFNTTLLLHAEPTIEALGHALAYAAAHDASLPAPLLALYECTALRRDAAFYAEAPAPFRVSRREQAAREVRAADKVMQGFEGYLGSLAEEVGVYVRAPIVSERGWREYFEGLRVLRAGEVFGEGGAGGGGVRAVAEGLRVGDVEGLRVGDALEDKRDAERKKGERVMAVL